jgi:multicomponent K+:H+ antiporter subunit G
MNGAAQVPIVVAAIVALLAVASAVITLIGTLGLIRLKTFYERIHAPTMGTTLGIALMLLASMLWFSFSQARPVIHELLILLFMVMSTPTTYLLLARASVYRDRACGKDEPEVPL